MSLPLTDRRRGESNHCAKLTEDDVRAIRKNPRGLSMKALGKLYGVSPPAIHGVVHYYSWAHVE